MTDHIKLLYSDDELVYIFLAREHCLIITTYYSVICMKGTGG